MKKLFLLCCYTSNVIAIADTKEDAVIHSIARPSHPIQIPIQSNLVQTQIDLSNIGCTTSSIKIAAIKIHSTPINFVCSVT